MVISVVEAESISARETVSTSTIARMPLIQILVQSSQEDIEQNRPPLYSEECLNDKYPVKCSSENIAHFVRENLRVPEDATITGYDGVEVVSLQISKEGDVQNIQVQSDKSGCSDCQTSAYSVIAAMPDKWVPALENGNPVATKVAIPIEFRTLD